jgi:hypothetical protein
MQKVPFCHNLFGSQAAFYKQNSKLANRTLKNVGTTVSFLHQTFFLVNRYLTVPTVFPVGILVSGIRHAKMFFYKEAGDPYEALAT